MTPARIEEATRMRQFPGIGFRGDNADREAWVIGTGLDVWEMVEACRGYGSVDALAADVGFSKRQIELALAYRDQYPDEIEGAIAENNRPVAELRELYRFITFETLPED